MIQPMQDPHSIQRREMDVEDYIDIVRRHKGWIIGPMLACLVIGVVVAFLWPDTYVSAASIRVLPPQIPDRYVASNVNADISQRINSIYQSITSRAALTNLINLHQLYPRDRKRLPIEDVIEQMRRDISVRFLGNVKGAAPVPQGQQQFQAFEISFAYSNRLLAQKIVQELVTRFIDENIRTRASQSVSTTDFLQDQWDTRKRELDEIEKKLTEYRVANAGRLPEERMNLQGAINLLEGRITNINSQITRAGQDKLLLESRLAILNDQLKQADVPEAVQKAELAKGDRLAQVERDVLVAETTLEAMRQSYKDNHPDVRRQLANIEVLKRQKAALEKQEEARRAEAEQRVQESANGKKAARATRESRVLEAEIASTRSLLEARANEIDNYQKELQGAERNMRSYQAQLERMPAGIAEYEQLLRDRQLAALRYEEMNAKLSASKSSTDMENRKQGETLELLDQPSLPTKPEKPNRPVIVAAAPVVGLVIGFALAAARELKDSTLKNLKDVRAYTQLMVLGSVPLIENDALVRRRRRMGWLAWTTASLVGIAIMAGSVVFYYANKA